MPKTKRAIVSVTNDLFTDNRVNKVCLFLVDQGYTVTLVGRKRKSSSALPERPYKSVRMKLLFETGAKFYAAYSFRLFWYLIFHKADVLVANDLDTLLANYLAKKFKPAAELVYDSHEYFTEVPELTSRPKVQKIWLKIERRIFPKLKKCYTVNSSIAEIYHGLYGKEMKVVRNISPLWKSDNLTDKKTLGIPENKPLIILQGAGINIDRGAEEAVEAMQHIDAVLMIVGDGDVVPELKNRVNRLNLAEKVFFFGKKPYDVMMNYTAHADFGLTLDKPTNLNYKLSLPNKVFDYLHTSTVVISSEIKEVADVVRTHKIGEVLPEVSPTCIAEKINSLLADPERMKHYKANCKLAAQTENWENETKVLNEIYPKVGE
ncbi:MAG: glycosyltransferase [Crocinitomicaceae bacterium]